MADIYQYTRLTTVGNYAVKGNNTIPTPIQGFLHTVVINQGSMGGTITIYDGLSNAGAVMAVVDASIVGEKTYDMQFITGLFIVVSGNTVEATVSWR